MYNSRPSEFQPSARARRRRLTAVTSAVTAVLATALAGCSDTFRASSRADQMFEGVATRFAPNVYGARYNDARIKLAQSALVPSRIFNDTSVWGATLAPTSRTLLVFGGPTADGRYFLDVRPSLPAATRPGESRHVVALEQVSPNQYRWDTHVDMSIGAVPPDEIAAALDALLRAPEGRGEKQLRDEYRTAFPRATAAFGRGFTLDSVAIAPAALGTTSVTLRFAFDPKLMKASFPKLADYLDKYLGPAKYHFTVVDRSQSNATLFDIVGQNRTMTLRYRVQQGRLVTLVGPPRAWSDSLTLMADLSLKVKLFTVGFHELATDFILSNTTSGNVRERAWTIVAQREPKWDLPLITERLIRSPLHRPFEGQGALFRLSVREDDGGQTMFGRHTRLDVQESAIMRFLGSLGSRAVGDLEGSVEDEEHRFLREAFVALRADLR